MSRHHTGLSRIRSHLAAHAVGIAYGDVEKLPASRGLIVSDGCLHHMTEIIEFMTQILLLTPSLVASPLVWLLRILCARGVEVAIRFLCRGYHVEHGVDILHQLLVGICLQDIRGTFYGLVRVGVVEGESPHLEHLRGVIQMLCGIRKIGVAPSLLTLRESERDGHHAAGFETLPPECPRSHLDTCKRHGIDGVSMYRRLFLLCRGGQRHTCHHDDCQKSFHIVVIV